MIDKMDYAATRGTLYIYKLLCSLNLRNEAEKFVDKWNDFSSINYSKIVIPGLLLQHFLIVLFPGTRFYENNSLWTSCGGSQGVNVTVVKSKILSSVCLKIKILIKFNGKGLLSTKEFEHLEYLNNAFEKCFKYINDELEDNGNYFQGCTNKDFYIRWQSDGYCYDDFIRLSKGILSLYFTVIETDKWLNKYEEGEGFIC